MSEQINKVLASTEQAFTTAEQLQARTNIAAQASGDYVSASTFSAFSAHVESAKLDASASGQFQPSGNYQTAGDYAYNSAVSAKQDSSAMSNYVPFSAISADSDSAITSINGSSVGKFTGVSAGDNLSGNGLSSSPIGLNSSVRLHDNAFPYKDTYISAGSVIVSGAAYAGLQVYANDSASVTVNDTGMYVKHTASGIGGGATGSYYGEVFSLCYNGGDYYLKEISADGEGIKARDLNTPTLQSVYGFGSAQFTDSNGASATFNTGGMLITTTTGSGYGEYGRGAMVLLERTGAQDYQAEYGHFHGTGLWYSHNNSDWDALSANWQQVSLKTWNGIDSASSRLDASSLQFVDYSGNLHIVDSASIDRWNAGSWNESANSIGTGFGGNKAVSASQYNYDAYSNWACREVYGDGIPAQQLYGFQSIPGTQGKYNINESGVFVPVDLPTFNLKVYKPTTANMYLTTADYPAMPATADGLLILVNLGTGPAVVYPNTFGATANIAQNNSAQLIWDHDANAWVRLNT